MNKLVKLFFVLFLALPPNAWGYNFLYIHPTSGEPIGWEAGTTIQYYLDPGKLGRLTNDQAHTLIKEAMKIWENASSNADVPHFEFAGYLPEDVNGTNYESYVSLGQCYTNDLNSCGSDSQKNFQTVIIFDEDDSILDNELCRISSCSASAGAKVFSGSSSNPENIVQGIAVFGGEIWGTANISAVTGVMVHELGHLLGLAHTSVNQEIFRDSEFGENDHLLPTMFFKTLALGSDKTRATLHPDDVAGISNLYPSSSFETETSSIAGTVTKSDGSVMIHVNVVARNIDDPLCKAYSFLSGRSCELVTSICEGLDAEFQDPDYSISGLPPGSYTVEVEEVANSLANTLAPGLLSTDDIFGDAEFWNDGDAVNESNTLSTAIELSAGEAMENIDIVLNRSEVTEDRVQSIPLSTFTAGDGSDCPEEPDTDYAALIGVDETNNSTTNTSSSTAGGCSLVRGL